MSLPTYLAGVLLYIHVTYGIFIYNVDFILIPVNEFTRVGTLIVAAIYLQLIQNRYMF